MKKACFFLFIATMLCYTGVTAKSTVKEIAVEQVSKIEKSYALETVSPSIQYEHVSVAECSVELYQDDIYYFEEQCYSDYCLPQFEEVCMEPVTPPPLQIIIS